MDYKLGKLKPRIDTRTIKMARILKTIPPSPQVYNVDQKYSFLVDNKMFANDQWGDCVIAGRAHMTLRFEAFEQNMQIPISDDDVLAEYWIEQGAHEISKRHFCKTVTRWDSKPDNGLVMLDSLNSWRQEGWSIGGKNYPIYAFAGVNWKAHDEVKATVYLLNGAYAGFVVPQSAMDQFNAGKPWTVVPGSPIIGGHAVYIVGYDEVGLTCITWGKPQKMDWNFWDTQFDEAYGVVDNRDKWLGEKSPVDVNALNAILAEITQ
jgi:hypothetical protein